VAGGGCYLAVEWKNKRKWDDALDVWGVHGIGGLLGTILLGVFAAKTVNPAGADGAAFGGWDFFWKETISVIATCVYAFVFTYIMLWIINKITPVRISEKDELVGIDIAIHGEKAYDEGVL
jgi:Amt family ammonium transporter